MRILYISGSIGLGHVWRDMAIAKELRRIKPAIDIVWMAEHPAVDVLWSMGERVLPDAEDMIDLGQTVDRMTKGYETNMTAFSMKWLSVFPRNARVILDAVKREGFDLVIGDEAYDVVSALMTSPEKKTFPFVLIYDFVGHKAMTCSLKEHLEGWLINRFWIDSIINKGRVIDRLIFIGVLEDVPDERFGLMQPNKRDLVKDRVQFVGYVLPFDPRDYQERTKVRRELGYSDGPLIVASAGGTATGKLLLDLCARAYPLLKQRMPGLTMVLVCGPKTDPSSITAADGLQVKGYVPLLYRHLAAADLCICSGGGTTTLELTALQKPFLFFPLERYSEQDDVANRCRRYGAGVHMRFSRTTPEVLARKVMENIVEPTRYPDLPLGGEAKAAAIINHLLEKHRNEA
jgi:UDP:flavonoid glycosyltransferase YjiC (YdhE family)